jgi:transposase-like protein
MSSSTRSPSTTDRWRRLVSDLERSGLPVRAFAASVDVNPSTLTWWRSQLRQGSARRTPLAAASGPPAAAFVELEVYSPRSAPPSLRVCLRDSRVSIDVAAGADLAWLRQVVEALC